LPKQCDFAQKKKIFLSDLYKNDVKKNPFVAKADGQCYNKNVKEDGIENVKKL